MANSSGSEFVDYYALLNVPISADIPQIRRAYLLKAKEHHPDAGGSTASMQQLNLAYKTLMNGSVKAAYDLKHSFNVGNTEASDYSYQDGRKVEGVSDMSDDEIDSFLDDLLVEYRNEPPKTKQSAKQRFKKLFEI